MKIALFLAVCILAGVAHASPLYAGQPGFYIGGALGNTNTQVTADGETDEVNETGFKITSGYRLNEYIALEGSYFNPGDITESDSGVSLNVRANFWQAAVVGSVPFGRSPVFAFGRLGVDYWDAKLTGCSGGFCNTLTSDGTDFHWGLGVGWHINESMTVRGEIEQTQIDQNIVTLPTTWRIRFLSASLLYRF